MDLLSNINKNIFVDLNNHASSSSINFSSVSNNNNKMSDVGTSSGKIPSYSDLKNEQNEKEEIKPYSSNNLPNPKKKQKSVQDPLSYSNYSSSLKKISDPLSQMKPVSTFGYPTKNKNSSNTKKENSNKKETVPLKENNSQKTEQKTEANKKGEITQNIYDENKTTFNEIEETTPLTTNKTNIDTNNLKVTNTPLMTSIFGNYNNLNLSNNNANSINNMNLINQNSLNQLNTNNQMNMMMNMNYLYMIQHMNAKPGSTNITNMQNMATIPNTTNMTNMQNMTIIPNTTNMTNMQNMTSIPNTTNITNMQNMTIIPNTTNITNMQNMTSIPNSSNITNMTSIPTITNMTNMSTSPNTSNMSNMVNLNAMNYQAFNNQNMNLYNNTSMGNYSKRNDLRNELHQIYKPGDLYSDTNLIREKCGLMKCETIKDFTKASYMYPEKRYMGILVLTDFRLIFQIENESNLTYNYSEDYFKFPLFSIAKIEKVQDKKMAYDAYPLEVTLKDTRVIKFHVWDQQRFYYNLSDTLNPKSPKVWFIFAEEYNRANFQNKNITNGWNIYDPVMEFSRQGVTEDNDLGLRYCYINKDFSICPTYPKFLIEPRDITDEELKQSSSYRTKGRLPIFSYYYNGNREKNLKGTPSIWRSAQNKRGIIGNKTSISDIKLLNTISKLGGKLYIYDCRPKLNALVNRVNGGGYENVDHYDNVSIYFCEIDNIHKARKALYSLNSLCLSNKINDYNNFWTNLEQSGWFQFIYLMLKNANEISKILQNNHSVLVHCSDGWDRTAQLSSLSQMLLDPFYRTINGFAILVEKDWLSFGHQFGLRNGFAEKEKQDQASPIFLQFLDSVHQLLEQFPNSFEFNEKFLLFLAKTYNLNLYGTFMYNNEKERTEANAKFNTASVWTEIFKDLKPYLNVYYDANSMKILEPNYSYYNLKIWTSLFMENNIYLENRHFYITDMDKNIAFKSKQEFFAYKKKEDESKYMDYQLKYEELLKVAADTYFVIKDNNEIFDKLSDESKKLIDELKPKLEKINKNRLKKKELVEKLKGKKETKNEKNNEKEEKDENKKDEEDKKKEEEKEKNNDREQKADKEEKKEEIKEDNKEEIQKEENKEEVKKEEDKKEEVNEVENKIEEVNINKEINNSETQNNEEKREENDENKENKEKDNQEIKN